MSWDDNTMLTNLRLQDMILLILVLTKAVYPPQLHEAKQGCNLQSSNTDHPMDGRPSNCLLDPIGRK